MPRTIAYAGCYTHDSDVAIRAYDASDPDGGLEVVNEVRDGEHHSFLAAHPDGTALYAVSETTSFDGAPGGGVCAYRIDRRTGSLSPLDRTSSHGSAPCFVDVSHDGRRLLVANYASGTVAAYELRPDGRFGDLLGRRQHLGSGPHERQERAHAHCFRASRHGRSGYAVDLGIDRVVRYTFDDGLAAADELVLSPGSGPRHLAIHPHLPVAFVVCELDCTLVTADIEPSGRLTARGSLPTLPNDAGTASIAAEVRIHPDGRHVYVSNRGHDSIAVFELDDPNGLPRPVGHVSSGGTTPRGFAVHPAGRALLVANQDSNSIVPFALDADSGLPTQRDERHAVTAPVCLTFVELDR